MFVRPYYSSILAEQYLILNRNISTLELFSDDLQAHENESIANTQNRKDYTVFICSTMYREKVEEMEQILWSLR